MSIWIDIGKGRKYRVSFSEPVNRLQDPWDDLAQAVILQAVKDYRRVRGTAAAKELEQFFLSEWFCVLTRLDGAALLERLRKETRRR